MPQAKTRPKVTAKCTKKPASANPTGTLRGRKPYPLDADSNKIRPEKENKETGRKTKEIKKIM